tara:strand:+ start:583 stop:1386 length:804 start_codon:yes stop_codon:yes gene_type:complete
MKTYKVCFFMPFYKREEVTCMAMWSLRRAMDKFAKAGHDPVAIVVGNEEGPGKYAESLGMTWLKHENKPLGKKMCFCVNKALATGAKYLVKVDSNNAYSDEYIDKCVDALQENYTYFGTKHFLVAQKDPEEERTVIFRCRNRKGVCGTMQFFGRRALLQATKGIENVWPHDAESRFDSKISKAFIDRWGERLAAIISEDPFDCVDVKSDTDMHPFTNYALNNPHPSAANGPNRMVVPSMFEAVRLLDEGYFAEALDKISAQEDEPSE